VFFGASLVIALGSMYIIMLKLRAGSVGDLIPRGLLWSGGLFLGGLVTFAYITLVGG
jgi:hypothetical protein